MEVPFKELLLDLFSKGKLFGTTHTYVGQEAIAVSVMEHLNEADVVFSSHRCHGHFLAKEDDPEGLLAEIMGRKNGVCGEWRHLQGEKTRELCLRFVTDFHTLTPRQQIGEPSTYPRRRPADSELDPNLSLADQFDLLRVVDNERYPAFFTIEGVRYELKIYKTEEVPRA